MAVTGARVTASTTAVALNTAGTAGLTLFVRNVDATDTCDIGGSGVTAGTGFPLAPNAQVEIELDAGDVVFAIRSAAADVDLAVLRTH